MNKVLSEPAADERFMLKVKLNKYANRKSNISGNNLGRL